MEWLEFILKFTYPGLKVSYGADSDALFEDPTLASCLADNLANDSALQGLIESIGDELLGLPDAYLEQFSEKLCYGEEDFDTLNNELENSYRSLKDEIPAAAQAALAEAKNSFTRGDPYLEAVWESFELLFTKFGPAFSAKEKMRIIWWVLNNRLGCCGWIALVMRALDCVAQGMGEEDFKSAMAESAIGAMDDWVFQRLVSGLPPEEQARVTEALHEDFANLPPPWDTNNYQAGSYAGSPFADPQSVTADQPAEEIVQFTEEDAQRVLDNLTLSGFLEFERPEDASEYLEKGSLISAE